MHEVRTEIGDILDLYCQPCHKPDMNPDVINRVCAHCQVGQKIQELGSYLGAFEQTPGKLKKPRKRKPNARVLPSKNQYLELKAKGYVDSEVRQYYGIGQSTLYRLKSEWDITETRGKKCQKAIVI